MSYPEVDFLRPVTNSPDPAKEIKTGAGRFPLVHKLVEFADIRRHYSEMRKALIDSNRQGGAYKGWITRWKNRYNKENLENQKLKIEIKQLWQDKKELADQIKDVSEKYKGMAVTLNKLQRFEDAVDQLRDLKLVVDDQVDSQGHWSSNSMLDLKQGVENFLQAVDKIVNDDVNTSN